MNQEMVYRSLFPRDLIMGLPRVVFIALLAGTMTVAIGFEQYWFFAVSVIGFFVGRILTKHDEHLIETAFSMLLEPNRLEP